MDFDRVLTHPLWKKLIKEDGSIIFIFDIGLRNVVLFTIDTDSVAMRPLPIDGTSLKPETKTRQDAWEQWFRPWCFTGTLLALVYKFAEHRTLYDYFYDIVDRKIIYSSEYMDLRDWNFNCRVDEFGIPFDVSVTETIGDRTENTIPDDVRYRTGSMEEINEIVLAFIAKETREIQTGE